HRLKIVGIGEEEAEGEGEPAFENIEVRIDQDEDPREAAESRECLQRDLAPVGDVDAAPGRVDEPLEEQRVGVPFDHQDRARVLAAGHANVIRELRAEDSEHRAHCAACSRSGPSSSTVRFQRLPMMEGAWVARRTSNLESLTSSMRSSRN